MDIAFLTGGTGFVGANLIRLLAEKNLRVRVLARKNSDKRNLEGLPVEIVEGGLLDPEALEIGCRGARYVFHLAADYRIWAPDPTEMYKTNVEGTKAVLTAATQAKAEKIVYCSSVAAVRPPDGKVPSTEENEYSGTEEIIGDYKKSKYLGEQEALRLSRQGGPIVIVNPSAPIGPLDIKPTPTGKIIVDFLSGRMPSYIDTGLNLVDVRDAALGHYLAALKGKIGERYILAGENLTFKRILDILSEETGIPAPRFKTPYAVAWLYGAVDTARARALGGEPRAPLDAVRMARHFMWFDSSKARRELGFPVSDARRALKDAVSWFVEKGYAPRPVPA